MDHRLPRDVVDLASYRAKGRSPFLTLRGGFPLCTPVSSRGAKGWWRQEGQQCCQTPSISVSTFLRSSSLPPSPSPHFPPFDFSFCRTRVCYTRSTHPHVFPLPSPTVNVSLRNPPSFLPPSIRFPSLVLLLLLA